ncbi:hypothetical protein HAX54_044019 [Datura stramonium]|uniref:Uncharacterized protein n=1 Tax=Datura stramonium TaxID=4076 RepID=A0ABS8W4J2_DATST|nr:hypothetical protein [Datura stramonium]
MALSSSPHCSIIHRSEPQFQVSHCGLMLQDPDPDFRLMEKLQFILAQKTHAIGENEVFFSGWLTSPGGINLILAIILANRGSICYQRHKSKSSTTKVRMTQQWKLSPVIKNEANREKREFLEGGCPLIGLMISLLTKPTTLCKSGNKKHVCCHCLQWWRCDAGGCCTIQFPDHSELHLTAPFAPSMGWSAGHKFFCTAQGKVK